jgi:hypothetical protein
VDGLEPIVEDDVELGRDATGHQIANQSHLGGMEGRPANKLTATTAGLPLGKFAPILKGGLQDVSRTPPDMEVAERSGRFHGATKALFGRKTIQRGRRDHVQKVLGMLHGHRPEIGRSLIGPPKLRMEELAASLGNDGADSAFSNAILVMGTDARDREPLVVGLNLSEKFQLGENPVVGAVSFDGDSTRQSEPLKIHLGPDRFTCTEGDLKVRLGETGGHINEQGTATKFVGIFLPTTRLEKATTFGDLELVNRNFITRFKFAVGNAAHGFRTGFRAGGPGGTPNLFGVGARSALRAGIIANVSNGGGPASQKISAGQPLDNGHSNVAKTGMPTKGFLLTGSKILVVLLRDTGVEALFERSGGRIRIPEQSEDREAGGRVKRRRDHTAIRAKHERPPIGTIDAIVTGVRGGHETLGRQEADRQTLHQDSLLGKDANATFVVEDLVTDRAFAQDSQPTGDAAHIGARRGFERPRKKIGLIIGGDLGTPGVHNTTKPANGVDGTEAIRTIPQQIAQGAALRGGPVAAMNLPGHVGDRPRTVGRIDRRESEDQGHCRGETTTEVAKGMAGRGGVRRRAGKRGRGDTRREGGDKGAEAGGTPNGHVDKDRNDPCCGDDRDDVTGVVARKDGEVVMTMTAAGKSLQKTPPAQGQREAQGEQE